MSAIGRRQPTLVVLRALGLGDALTGLPALRALADAFPAHHKIVAAPGRFAPLLVGPGAANEVVDHHGLRPLPPALREPDVAVDLHGRGPGSQPLLIALRPRRLIAFVHPDIPETEGGPCWRAGEHEVVRWCRLLSESGIPADPRRLDIEPDADLARPAGAASVAPRSDVPARARGATVIHPGAGSPARQWPPERFAAVARAEVRSGRRVVVTGTASERELAENVAARAGLDPSGVIAGNTDVIGLARLVAAAGRVVCGDTGVAHMATAVGTPSVVLFGPVSPLEWGPPPDRLQHIALWAGHTGDPHGAVVDPGLLALRVDDVLDALARLPANPRTGGRSLATIGGPT